MIRINGKVIPINKFPDGTLLIKEKPDYDRAAIAWNFENNEELIAITYLTHHLRANGVQSVSLFMPYIPNARQDRVKSGEDVFTLRHFAWLINALMFDKVFVLDPHSTVSEALIDRIEVLSPKDYIESAFYRVCADIGNSQSNILMFYPDEGAMKRYSSMFHFPYAFGIKKRDWRTGTILGLDVAGDVDAIKGNEIIIVDDICSRGGTFYHSAKKLKELGASRIFLYVTHCENTILDGEVLSSGLIEKVYTTDSLFTGKHERIEVIKL